MRTTITLDDDVVAIIEQERARTGGTFRSTLNRLVRRGRQAPEPRPRVELPLLPGKLLVDISDVSAVLAELDDERLRERGLVWVLVDTNLLIYAAVVSAPQSPTTRAWLEERMNQSGAGVVLCWPVVLAFLRLVTNPRIVTAPSLAMPEAWSIASAYLRHPGSRLVVPGETHREIVEDLLRTPGLRSNDVPDVEIAALAIEHGLVLATHDRGFRRFDGLRVFDPLTESPARGNGL